MATPILDSGGLLPAIYRAEQRVRELAELQAAEDLAMTALLDAYQVPLRAQETHLRQAERRQLAFAAIAARLAAIRAAASRVLP